MMQILKRGTWACSFLLPLLLMSTVAHAQWVTFQNETSARLVATSSLGASDLQEKDYAWGDVDQDGDIDLVCVRKQPFTSTGRFPNVLFMNESGVLTDRTAMFASASSVSGSSGFLDDTNDRDVVLADLNGDGWLDIATAVTLSGSNPKYISHPRVYINQGMSGGTWQGFIFDDENRIPTMPDEPRFCSISAGDIDNDGDLDLYMGDYQQGGTRPIDLNDRLFINDGTGYFTDESSLRMSATMLESSFAMATAMADMNQDGKLDILKDDALNAPQGVSVSYNDGASPGFFSTYSLIYTVAPYHIAVGDLNNDSLPDLVVTDDGADRFSLHGGVSGNVATFPSNKTFTYSNGAGDDGFGGNNLIIDLNNDGFNDVLITDVDVDISGCNRRMHIYRNLGNVPNVTLDEQGTTSNVCGIPTSMLVGTHDVAVFDINGDGWKDLVIGRCTGTQVWMNDPPTGLAFSYPNGLPSNLPLSGVTTLTVDVTGIGGTSLNSSTVTLHTSVNNGPFSSQAMSSIGGNSFQGAFPAGLACSDEVAFYVSAEDTMGGTHSDPSTGAAAPYRAVAADGLAIILEEGFESGSTGWTVVNNASLSTGAWEVATPIGTILNGAQAAPSEDAEALTTNTNCFVTQNGVPGGSVGAADVDGGPTDLISPAFDFSGTDGVITYSRWYFSSGADPFEISVSGDGTNWVNVETLTGSGENQWTVNSFRVGDYITPTATVQVRFRIGDYGGGSITEAGVDVFRVERFTCDVCQPDIGFQGPGTATLSMCGGDLSTGTTADLVFSGGPANSLVYLGVDVALTPVPFGMGTIISPAPLAIIPMPTDANGSFTWTLPGGGGPVTVYAQVIYADATLPGGAGFSNAIAATWLP